MFYLYSARAARGFGDGFAALILPAYLSALGFGPVQIGIVAALRCSAPPCSRSQSD